MSSAAVSDGVFCYECNSTYSGPDYQPVYSEEFQLCPECGSDFVEIVAPPPPQQNNSRPSMATAISTLPNLSISPRQIQPPMHPQPMDFAATAALPTGGLTRVSLRVITVPMGEDGQITPDIQRLLAQASEYGGALLGVHVGPDGSISNPVQFNLSDFAGGAGLEQLLDQLAQQHQPAADPANRAVVEALPKLEVAPLVDGSSGNGGDVGRAEGKSTASSQEKDFAACQAGEPCAVCHNDFQAGERVTQLGCRHCFHGDCILPWLETHNTCPVCRHSLPREVPGVDQQGDRSQEVESIGLPPERVEPRAQLRDFTQNLVNQLQQSTESQLPLVSSGAEIPRSSDVPVMDNRDEPEDTGSARPASDYDMEQSVNDSAPLEPGEVASGGGRPTDWVGRAMSWLARAALHRG